MACPDCGKHRGACGHWPNYTVSSEAAQSAEPSAQQATIERLTKERDAALAELRSLSTISGQTIAELRARLAKPEMPECVAKLVDWARTLGGPYTLPGGLVDKIRDHYAQPLKLEVGKVYEDGHEGPVQIVWKSPSRNGYRWLGVVVTNGETRWFNDDGKPPCQTPEFKLIREVRQ